MFRLGGEKTRVIGTPRVTSGSNGVAVTRDGSTLLVSDFEGGSHAIHAFNVADGRLRRVIGKAGKGPLQFYDPQQLWIADDDFVFVADSGNNRVQVLSPRLNFHSFIGVGQVEAPAGVCANADVVVVSEFRAGRITVYKRGDGTRYLRRFGSKGSSDSMSSSPAGLCFVSGGRHVAVVDQVSRVSVFSLDGEFMHFVGSYHPMGVACSAFDEIVVVYSSGGGIELFSASGELLKSIVDRDLYGFAGVALRDGTLFAQKRGAKCYLYQ
jgi:DNA-binding beta-propeller fold protein YncE